MKHYLSHYLSRIYRDVDDYWAKIPKNKFQKSNNKQ